MGQGGANPFGERESPLLQARDVSVRYGGVAACRNIDLRLWRGEVLGIVGESGSGKTTLLMALSGNLRPSDGKILYRTVSNGLQDIYSMREIRRRLLMRTEWGFVYQVPEYGLRMNVSAGGNVAERLAGVGCRRYDVMRGSSREWMGRLQLDVARMDDKPDRYSGGMQQRLQIARILVSEPRLVFMDEPTGGLDASVQAGLLDTVRKVVMRLGLSIIVVTHDLAVARYVCSRLYVMKDGQFVEDGLTDQVLDDPQHAYTQLLVSSILSH